jgi:quercetin dioxygenase-like cupin family protein
VGHIFYREGIKMELDVILKRFDHPDETRAMTLGKFEIVHIGSMTVGRATYEPGWIWSIHVGPGVGTSRCAVEHIGMVVSGQATVEFEDGRIIPLRAGDLFYVPPIPHDSRVVGEERYVSLHFSGAEKYAK